MKKSAKLIPLIAAIAFCMFPGAAVYSQNALHFDGVDDYVQVPNGSGYIANAAGISLSLWVYPTNPSSAWPDFDGFGGFRNDANSDFYLCQLSSTNVEARFRNSSGTTFDINSASLVLNTWQHYVLTYDGSLLKLYRNGALLSSIGASGSISNATVPLYIGKLVYSANNFSFQGKVDELSLWNKALSATEVSNLYSGITNMGDVNLKLYYKFDQGVANGSNAGITTLTDSKGNANGTLYNFALSGTSSNWVGGILLSIPTDAGLLSYLHPGDTTCGGSQSVKVVLKNFGPNPLATAKINWKVNSSLQPQFTWNGNLAVNGTDTITIGNYPFHHDTTYALVAWSSLPNTVADTASWNDSITKAGIHVKAAPQINLAASTFNICQGDTAFVTGTLTGTPPWSVTISNGIIFQTFQNITLPSFTLPLAPPVTTTYTILAITDAGGCPSTSPVPVVVTINPAPPAGITPLGATACCAGDSVMLQATIGANLTYGWIKDGTAIPGATNFIFAAKQAGAYTVKVTSPTGCSATSAAVNVVVHPAPPVFIGNDTSVAPSAVVTLNAGSGFTSYLWSTGATTAGITVDSTGTGTGAKTVWVVVTDNYGCKGSDTIQISFVNNPGMGEFSRDPDLFIYPNPTPGLVNILYGDAREGEIIIGVFSAEGFAVHRQAWHAGGEGAITIDLTGLPSGTYSLRLTGKAGIVHRRIVLLR